MSVPPPPVDPRAGWSLPEPGELPTVARLDDVTTRVLAANPSPMTLDGTNTYLIGERGHPVIVVDPGPDDPGHLGHVEQAVAAGQHEVAAIFVTHHHHDHAEAAQAWARRFGCQVVARRRSVAGAAGRLVGDGDVLEAGGQRVEVVETPGHTRDHLALRVPTGALLTGDHVLGRGTSVVAWPDGDLTAYLESLRRVLALGPDALFPGHGPELVEDPDAVLRYYRDHRAFREAQILAALSEGPATPRQLVARIYAEVDPRLWDAAEASTRATIASLEEREVVHLDHRDRASLDPSTGAAEG